MKDISTHRVLGRRCRISPECCCILPTATPVPIGDSERAVGMVNRERFEGIVLDLEMPKLNGFELLHSARNPRSRFCYG